MSDFMYRAVHDQLPEGSRVLWQIWESRKRNEILQSVNKQWHNLLAHVI